MPNKRAKAKRRLVLLLMVIFCCLSCLVLFVGINYVSEGANVVNHIGVVRGTSQRITKLELLSTNSDPQIALLEDVLDKLLTGSGDLRLSPLSNTEYRNQLTQTYYFWHDVLKPSLLEYREHIGPISSFALKDIENNSEHFFVMADECALLAVLAAAKGMFGLRILALALLFTIISFLIYFNILVAKQNKEITNIAFHDTLTGLYNKNRWMDVVPTQLSQGGSYALVLVDVDKFSVLNDALGFAVGSRLLVTMARQFYENIKSGEFFGRGDADEFYLLLEYENSGRLQLRLNSLLESIETSFYSSLDTSYNLQLCTGVYPIDDNTESLPKMLDKLRFAHRACKKRRDHAVSFYNKELLDDILMEKGIENQMKAALAAGEIQPFLQPKYSLSSGKIQGAEALARWKKPDGFIYPNQFIPVFEKTGFIVKLDFHILRASCRMINDWITAGFSPVTVSVNFSRLHLANPNFAQQLTEVVDSFGLPHHFIEIEITESTILDNSGSLRQLVDDLHSRGFTLSMDDFGTGYSSLGLLKDMPIDIIKMDQSFFTGATDNSRARAVIGSIMHMAKKLEIITVAEGVETLEHVEMLREMGCDLVQGFYYAKPMPEADFTALIAAQSVQEADY